MPIDKLTPRFLVSDKDERLLKEGAMTDALNVTISEDGAGSEGVVKNVKGTDAADPVSGLSLPDNSVKVVGSVSDHQLGKIYFFVADNVTTTNGPENAIYQYDTSSDEYKLVFKSGWLEFDPNGFVKADVLNGDFQQDGSTQTILYFTDNKNQPRKINVSRAIDGDFDLYPYSQLDYALNTIKAPVTNPPSFFFETNSSVQSNNLIGKAFQFATQLVYKDGEESAISPYSALAFPSFYPEYGTTESVFESYQENVCAIDLKFKQTDIRDVERIRVIGRVGNSGNFFLIDDLDVTQDKNVDIFGASVNIYDHTNGLYRFYNDGVYGAVDLNLVNKSYDNVPLLAQGQALAGNRLIYSNYVEGRENTPIDATITVSYKEPLSDSAEYIDTLIEYPSPSSSNGDVVIDFNNISWPLDGSTPYVPAGTMVSLRFVYDSAGSFYQSGSPGVIEFDTNAGGEVFRLGYSSGSTAAFPISEGDGVTVSAFYKTETQITVPQLAEIFSEIFSENTSDYEKTYSVADDTTDFYIKPGNNFAYNTGGSTTSYLTTGEVWVISGAVSGTTTQGGSLSGTLNIQDLNVNINYRFDDVDYTADSSSFTLKPYVSSASINTLSITGSVSGDGQNFNFNRSFGSNLTGATSTEQSDFSYTITNTSDYLTDSSTYANISQAISSFKAGSSHPLGVVYYDKYGRHGFVNEIGSAYVKGLWERTTAYNGSEINKGPAEIQISFNSEPPDWMDSFQIVYGGPSAYDSFLVNAVSIGEESDPTYSGTSKKIYVSLKPLELYKENTSRNRDYSYTEGDKLRVLYNTASDNSLTYKNSNAPGAMEFDIVGVVQNPADSGIVHVSSSGDELHSGQWLILEAPVINSGGLVDSDADEDGDPDNLKYVGYDFFSIANDSYPNGDQSSDTNLWENGTIVEIYSPRKTSSEQVYYEIGARQKRNIPRVGSSWSTDHGPAIKTMNGSVWWRNVTFTLPEQHNNAGHLPLADYPQKTYYIECETPSESTGSKDWHKGKPHVVYEGASEKRLRNGLIYSDPYAEDVANLSLSSFNPSLANFESLEGRYGAVEYIGNYNDDIVALQENKLCLIPVNKNILEYASGSADVAVSTNVLGQRRYSSGDYGSGGHPEAVLIQDNSVYFVDESRQAVCGLIGGQLVPISEKGMSSFFEDFFTNSHTKYVSGYDPRDNTYYLTGLNGSDNEYKTIGYDAARGVWQSRYSFQPDVYANQNNMLYSAKYTSGNNIFWKHDNTAYNTFYGTEYPSTVQVVSKLSPSRVKVFNAISYEGDSDAWETPSNTPIYTSLAMFAGQISSWSEREGSYYASIPKDVVSPELIYLGTISSAANNDLLSSTLTMSDMVRFDRLPIDLITTEEHSIPLSVGTQVITSFSQPDKEITLFGNFADPASLAGTKLYAKVFNSYALRGHWAKITLANSSTSKHELYCINTHVTDSKSHHPLGQ